MWPSRGSRGEAPTQPTSEFVFCSCSPVSPFSSSDGPDSNLGFFTARLNSLMLSKTALRMTDSSQLHRSILQKAGLDKAQAVQLTLHRVELITLVANGVKERARNDTARKDWRFW